MTSSLWLAAVIAAGAAAPVAEADVYAFGFCRQFTACPAAEAHYKAACEARWDLYPCHTYEWMGRWWGRDCDYRLAVADAEWRKDVWTAVWWATDKNVDPLPRLRRLRELIGPAAYQLRRLPPPVPGAWPE